MEKEKKKKKRTPVLKATKFDTSCISEKHLFHNIELTVYLQKANINNIYFWPDNARNILDFDVLKKEHGVDDITKIPIDTIVKVLARDSEMKLGELKKSIINNGVRVPLIILDNGILLDGNRRYFASKLYQYEVEAKGEKLPKVLQEIPVWVIRDKDVGKREKDKILAEANFVPDFKVPWPLRVRAKVIEDFFNELYRDGKAEEEIYLEIMDTFAVRKQEVKAYVAATALVNEFTDMAETEEEQLVRRGIVETKFVYFWEFHNKACKGKGALSCEELEKSKEMFFELMRRDKLKNIKQVEPAAKAVRDDYSWSLLCESGGDKIGTVELIYKEKKETKSIEDKFRNFINWFDKEGEAKLQDSTVTKATFRLIDELAEKLKKYTNKGK